MSQLVEVDDHPAEISSRRHVEVDSQCPEASVDMAVDVCLDAVRLDGPSYARTTHVKLGADDKPLHTSPEHSNPYTAHTADLFRSMRTRQDPVSPVEAGHAASTIGNVAVSPSGDPSGIGGGGGSFGAETTVKLRTGQ